MVVAHELVEHGALESLLGTQCRSDMLSGDSMGSKRLTGNRYVDADDGDNECGSSEGSTVEAEAEVVAAEEACTSLAVRTSRKRKAVDEEAAVENEKEDQPREVGAVWVGFEEALARLEAEVAANGSAWRIPAHLVLAAPWDESWKAGMWVAVRRCQGARAVAARRNMTPAQRTRFEALPYGVLPPLNADDALSRLEAEVASRGEAWRINKCLVLAAPWDETWAAGVWICSRTGQRAKPVALRQKMTPAQRSRLDALPYGELTFDVEEALVRLEAEVAAKGTAWHIPHRLVISAPWDEHWKAGRWLNNRRGQSAQAVAARQNMTPAQRRRLEALR